MRRWVDSSWVLIVVVGAFAAGYLLNPMINLPNKWQPGWEMMSAIGTIAAAVIALGISLRETAMRKRAERVRAHLAAQRLILRLNVQKNYGGFVVIWIDSVRKSIADKAFGNVNWRFPNDMILKNSQDPYDDADLQNIGLLDTNIVATLIEIREEIEMCVTYVSIVENMLEKPPLRTDLLDSCSSSAIHIKRLINKVVSTFKEHGFV